MPSTVTTAKQTAACDTLFFDAQCPICSAEVNSLKEQADSSLSFVDIHEIDESEDKATLFNELHVQRADGTWAVGLEANILAWQHTRWRSLVSVLKWPVIRPIANLGYRVWLRWYQWQRKRR